MVRCFYEGHKTQSFLLPRWRRHRHRQVSFVRSCWSCPSNKVVVLHVGKGQWACQQRTVNVGIEVVWWCAIQIFLPKSDPSCRLDRDGRQRTDKRVHCVSRWWSGRLVKTWIMSMYVRLDASFVLACCLTAVYLKSLRMRTSRTQSNFEAIYVLNQVRCQQH